MIEPMYINFEGPGGSGKTTTIHEVRRQLLEAHQNIDVLVVREPGDLVTGLRSAMRSGRYTGLSGERQPTPPLATAAMGLASALVNDAAVRLESGKRPCLVLRDRSVFSAFVYQADSAADPETRADMYARITGMYQVGGYPGAGHTFWLDRRGDPRVAEHWDGEAADAAYARFEAGTQKPQDPCTYLALRQFGGDHLVIQNSELALEHAAAAIVSNIRITY